MDVLQPTALLKCGVCTDDGNRWAQQRKQYFLLGMRIYKKNNFRIQQIVDIDVVILTHESPQPADALAPRKVSSRVSEGPRGCLLHASHTSLFCSLWFGFPADVPRLHRQWGLCSLQTRREVPATGPSAYLPRVPTKPAGHCCAKQQCAPFRPQPSPASAWHLPAASEAPLWCLSCTVPPTIFSFALYLQSLPAMDSIVDTGCDTRSTFWTSEYHIFLHRVFTATLLSVVIKDGNRMLLGKH